MTYTSDIDLEDYERWLREQGYADSTVTSSVSSAPGLLSTMLVEGAAPASSLWTFARRLRRYADERELYWASAPALIEATSNATARAALRSGKERKLEARAFDDGAWQRLAQAILADESRAGRVLEVVLFSGLRISDVLRIKRTSLFEAFETGVLELEVKGRDRRPRKRLLRLSGRLLEAFQRMGRAWDLDEDGDRRRAADVGRWLVPGSDAALPRASSAKQATRLLQTLGADAKVRGRIHLHRMRRTIAVQGLRVSHGDRSTVGQLLGHDHGSSATDAYIDEARIDDVATTLDAIHDRFLPKG